ncbi:MAG: acyl-CoA dehydrogenase family protein [Gammaproteobacteria bacterium]|nr:acyl-CoA dehydrogenase family protein [Gammaproteobacteria bacterium]MCY3688234.1 acyl-CoA dehydrogenase family protein [Gammaproteobacteria bacterium]
MSDSLLLTEEQQLLRESARGFCREQAPLSLHRKLRDSRDADGFDRDLWRRMVELGWTGMAIPEAYDGYGFGHTGLGLVLEETGRTLVDSPLIATVLLGANAILETGSEAQKAELLPLIVAGELLLAFALDERFAHDPGRIETVAVPRNGGFALNGGKTFVLDGHVAGRIIVAARIDGGSGGPANIGLFLVDATAPGLEVTRTIMIDGRNCANIALNDVAVKADDLLGGTAVARETLDRVLDIARIGLAAEMLGSIEEVFERTLDYLRQREQFGVPIGAFQALQHRAAEMYNEIELSRSLVRAALAALDDPASDKCRIARLASAAKAKLSEVFFLVSNEGIQMHGGIGMTDEFDIGFFLKRARVAQQFLGDAGFHRDRYAALHSF